jgi:hypothetical protein
MTRYLPPYDELCTLLGVSKDELQGSGRVQVPAQVLAALIRVAVAGLAIDTQLYREWYPDLDKTFKKRSTDIESHFKQTGYFEGRRFPLLVDVDYYRVKYPDLALALARGELRDLKTHFHEVGVFEQRVPSAEAEGEMNSWAWLGKTYGRYRKDPKTDSD